MGTKIIEGNLKVDGSSNGSHTIYGQLHTDAIVSTKVGAFSERRGDSNYGGMYSYLNPSSISGSLGTFSFPTKGGGTFALTKDTPYGIRFTGALGSFQVLGGGGADVSWDFPLVKADYINNDFSDLSYYKSMSGGVNAIDGAMSTYHSANRLAFVRPTGIDIEYSNDGGITWTNYDSTDEEKIKLVSNIGSTFTIGKRTIYSGTNLTDDQRASHNDKLRITFNGQNCGIYVKGQRFLINLSTNGATGSKVKVERVTNQNFGGTTKYTYKGQIDSHSSLPTNPVAGDAYELKFKDEVNNYEAGSFFIWNGSQWTNFIYEDRGTYAVSGWSGWNSIPLIESFGSTAGDNTANIRLTFSIDGQSPDGYGSVLNIIDIIMLGKTCWGHISNLGGYGTLYLHDWQQNANFPTGLNAKSIQIHNGLYTDGFTGYGTVINNNSLMFRTADSKTTYFITGVNMDDKHYLYYPTKSGTFATTDDIPNIYTTETGTGSSTKNIRIYKDEDGYLHIDI